MQFDKFLQSMREGLAKTASIKSVYGDPIVVGTKTVIPVARIAYGFGGGMGKNGNAEEDSDQGAGAGGGVGAIPLGVVEITPEQTRFLPFGEPRRLVLAALAGVLVGLWIGRRRRK